MNFNMLEYMDLLVNSGVPKKQAEGYLRVTGRILTENEIRRDFDLFKDWLGFKGLEILEEYEKVGIPIKQSIAYLRVTGKTLEEKMRMSRKLSHGEELGH